MTRLDSLVRCCSSYPRASVAQTAATNSAGKRSHQCFNSANWWSGPPTNRAERNTQYEVVRSEDRVQITMATAGTPPVRFAPINEPVTRIDLTDDGRLHITGASGATWQSQPVRYISDERALHPDAFATVRTPHAAPDPLGR